MSLLWYPPEIEQALSRRMARERVLAERFERQETEARRRCEAQTGTPSPRLERVMLEWVEQVELGEVAGWLLTPCKRSGGMGG